jgi:hypothetical protein
MTCLDCVRLQGENHRLAAKNADLRRHLAAYENPHIPPSRRMYPSRIRISGARRYLGRPRGHPGVMRLRPKPDVVRAPERKEGCDSCGAHFGELCFVGHRIVEKVSNSYPRQVIGFLSYEYECPEWSHRYYQQ